MITKLIRIEEKGLRKQTEIRFNLEFKKSVSLPSVKRPFSSDKMRYSTIDKIDNALS